MHYNQQSPWIPHHSASLSLTPTSNGRVPPPRTRHTTMSGLPFQPQPPSPNSSIPPRHNIPASLTPGLRPLSGDAGFQQQQTALLYNSSTSFLASPPHTSYYGNYFYPRQHPSSTSPPVPQKPKGITAPLVHTIPRPPIPPKPPMVTTASSQRNPLYPQSIPGPVAGPSSRPMPGEESPTDDKDIALALALSESEARQREDDILAQEEADLMKALEESRIFADNYSRYVSDSVFDGHQDSSGGPSSSSQPFTPSSMENVLLSPQKYNRFPEGKSFLHIITPTTSESSYDEEISIHQSGKESRESVQFVTDASISSRENLTPTPLTYNNAVSTILKPNDLSMNAGGGTAGTSTISSPPAEFCRSNSSDHIRPLPGLNPVSSHPMSSSQQNLSVAEPPPPKQPLPRRPSVANSETSSLSRRSSSSEQIPSLFTPATSVQTGSTSPPISFSLPSHTDILDSVDEDIQEEEEGDEGTDSASRPAPILTANQYVEPDMLMGVSMGFKPPSISTILSPMGEAMPNIITLPYGKAPTFHIQSPSWRHLLKLMARLSGTRVEPTIEALTVAKDELKLRTVIQFVKIHHSASEWRTVIYLTTDMPYTNGDVTVLPYSYTLSPLPQLLRDGADSPMAKYYVVPATNSTPYPTLPINFPNLAMYLQSAVQVSRKAAHDGSSGLRRLALNIDTCYPRDDGRPISTDFSDTSRSLGGMFKRVINRGKTPRGRGGNEEIYDLVTPFVPDEWG
ncbi:hypothetical protein DFJ58DRAFT_811214 [Suillus subalutaceus]|uniref:uncharacterized protein n=1 Tax=Suillus subalutaceus TaxID=48586 RepID=UPI001B8679C6|nr:uncharacterized protein DFJ58DRAFT_811214 [Suillus subalutaceus]KAG1840088.1 hypothetical protein DFJ58DRAFT_811214 [Suillus subalutaceus]